MIAENRLYASWELKSISYAKMYVKILPARAGGARGSLQLASRQRRAGSVAAWLAGFAAVPCGKYAGQSRYAGVAAEIPCAASKTKVVQNHPRSFNFIEGLYPYPRKAVCLTDCKQLMTVEGFLCSPT